MARQRKEEPADTLDELESLGERLMQWIGANPLPVLGAALLILVLAAAVGGYRAYAGSRASRASAALASLHTELVVAMGGKPTEDAVPEPANPETARTVRTQFADRYLALAKDWSGTPAQGLALLQAGDLFDQLGNTDRALEVWTEAVGATSSHSPTLGILQSRVATLDEEKGDFEAAARAHGAAAAVPGFPLAATALADAARCWAQAGKDDAALAAYRRLKSDYPDYHVPPYVEAKLSELEVRAGGSPAAASPPPAAANP